jgi:hypothetical protein
MTTTYQITTNAGKLVEFATALAVKDAYKIVATQPASSFIDWILSGDSEKQQLWALKVAQDTLDAENPTPTAVGQFLPLVAAVSRMQAKAKARVILRFEGATIKAVTKGVNEGSIYVFFTNGDYAGKVTPEGAYKGDARVKDALMQAAADPLQAAVAYGRQTGSCSCCGRDLDDPVSIFGGIGPVCLAKMAGPDARRQLEADYRECQAAGLIEAVLAI